MDELDELSNYNGGTVHDMNVDYDYHINTGELDDLFDETNLDDFDDWIKIIPLSFRSILGEIALFKWSTSRINMI